MYNKLVAITGLGGLFELISTKADGGIVRSLEDLTTKFVSNRVHNFSHLESIEIYTTGENVNLADIFNAMGASSEQLPEDKADNASLKTYFGKVFPTMDFERVYSSDMKKMVRWFKLIQKNNIEIVLSDDTDGAEDAVPEKNEIPKAAVQTKAAAVKNAPAKKVNAPRKMA
jgi:hypothetical protein